MSGGGASPPYSLGRIDSILNGALPLSRPRFFWEVRILKALRARITELRILKDLGERNVEECEGLYTSS